MATRAVSGPALAYAPALLAIAAFAVGHLFLPPVAPFMLPPVEMTEAEIAEADRVAALRAERYYIRVRNEIVATISSLDKIVKVEVAIVVPNGGHKQILTILEERPDELVTPLTEAVLDGAQGVTSLPELLQVLPPVLTEAMNTQLATEKDPMPVLEVLIINAAAQN